MTKLQLIAKLKSFHPRLEKQWQSLFIHLRDRKISDKLNLGFGILVMMIFLVIGRNYLGGRDAESNIQRTQTLRVPTALTSAQAQEDLLETQSNIRAYLATGESEYRYRYQQSRQRFEKNLVEMESLLNNGGSTQNRERLKQLKLTYDRWSELPDRLIMLQDNLLDNQPALRLLEREGQRPIIVIQRNIQRMLDEQEQRSPSVEDMALLRDLAEFQSTFALLVSSLQSHVVTRSPSFRFDYDVYAQKNTNIWKTLETKQSLLTPTQQANFQEIARMRQVFFELPKQMFEVVNSYRYRQNLYLFRGEAEPLAESMLQQLDAIVKDQEATLKEELKASNQSLSNAQWQTLLGGILALGLGLGMAIALRKQIAGPIQRLTEVTGRLRDGELDAQAPVESADEVGQLATSFNRMAKQLKESFETLEDKVKERTAELASANAAIGALNEKLKAENLRMGAELDVARQIQMMILPKPEELENIRGLDIAGYMQPADEVGGDYYDVLETEGVVTLGIGDVTGHGLESGILMLMTQTAVRTLQEVREVDPVRFLDTLNRTIYKNVQRMNSDKSLTLAIVNYAGGKISISGQHEETIIVRKNGTVQRIDTMDLGFPIGLDEEITDFINHAIFELEPGDGIVLYTDGIPEAKDINKVQYRVERLCEVIGGSWHKSSSEIKDDIITDLRRHIGTQKVFDDITLLVLKRRWEQPEEAQQELQTTLRGTC